MEKAGVGGLKMEDLDLCLVGFITFALTVPSKDLLAIKGL